jgi:AraC-like DNA-binding protein
MEPTETTSGAWVARLLMALAAYGLDCDALCRNAQLDQHSLRDPDASVNLDTWVALWRAAERASADPVLGVNVAKVARLDPALIVGYTFMAAHSLADFLRHHLNLQRITYHADVVSLYEMGNTVEVRFARPGGFSAASHHSLDYNCVLFVRWFRTFFGVVPRYITFRHPAPAGGADYTHLLGAPVHFARPENALVLHKSDFERSRPLYSEATFDRLCHAANEVLRELTVHAFRDRVCTILRRRLSKHSISVEAVSEALHVSPRTLQRRLTAEGTSFKQLLDWVRHETALARLRNGDSVNQIARATGFAEVASFCRAFRRWTGTSVAGFRERESGLRESA